jgi:hypothetical protein
VRIDFGWLVFLAALFFVARSFLRALAAQKRADGDDPDWVPQTGRAPALPAEDESDDETEWKPLVALPSAVASSVEPLPVEVGRSPVLAPVNSEIRLSEDGETLAAPPLASSVRPPAIPPKQVSVFCMPRQRDARRRALVLAEIMGRPRAYNLPLGVAGSAGWNLARWRTR